MRFSFVWKTSKPPHQDVAVIEENIRDEISHLGVGLAGFPDELIVNLTLTTPTLSIEGEAVTRDGKRIVALSYSLVGDHQSNYVYVG